MAASRPTQGAGSSGECATHVSLGTSTVGGCGTAGDTGAGAALVNRFTAGPGGALCIRCASVDQAIPVNKARDLAIELVGIALCARIFAIRIALARSTDTAVARARRWVWGLFTRPAHIICVANVRVVEAVCAAGAVTKHRVPRPSIALSGRHTGRRGFRWGWLGPSP